MGSESLGAELLVSSFLSAILHSPLEGGLDYSTYIRYVSLISFAEIRLLKLCNLSLPASVPEDMMPGQWNDEGEDNVHKPSCHDCDMAVSGNIGPCPITW